MHRLLLVFLLRCLVWVQAEGKLSTVIVVYRHGDRTPVNPYPTDPYRNLSYWPVGYGQLTNRGKEQQYELGKWLRNRYDGFLPSAYSEDDIYVRSTDMDRTLMSAYSNLAGLYEPQGKQIWNPDLKWQPIPVHTVPEHSDPVLAMKQPCDKFTVLTEQLLRTPEFMDIKRRNHDLFAYLSRYTGASVTNIQPLEYIYNTLMIERLYNFTLPPWTNQVFPDKMRPIAVLSFAVQCYTTDMARLKVGPLFYEFVEHLRNASVLEPNHTHKKMSMYSAHDTTIANVLNALGLFEYHSPPYASTILIELRQLNNSHYVNFYYKNSTDARKLKLKDCDADCPLDDFVKILEPVTLSLQDWAGECRVGPLTFMPFSTFQEGVIIASSAVFITLMIGLVACVIYARPKSEKRSYLRLPDSDEAA